MESRTDMKRDVPLQADLLRLSESNGRVHTIVTAASMHIISGTGEGPRQCSRGLWAGIDSLLACARGA